MRLFQTERSEQTDTCNNRSDQERILGFIILGIFWDV